MYNLKRLILGLLLKLKKNNNNERILRCGKECIQGCRLEDNAQLLDDFPDRKTHETEQWDNIKRLTY